MDLRDPGWYFFRGDFEVCGFKRHHGQFTEYDHDRGSARPSNLGCKDLSLCIRSWPLCQHRRVGIIATWSPRFFGENLLVSKFRRLNFHRVAQAWSHFPIPAHPHEFPWSPKVLNPLADQAQRLHEEFLRLQQKGMQLASGQLMLEAMRRGNEWHLFFSHDTSKRLHMWAQGGTHKT